MTAVEALDLALKWSFWIFNAGLAMYVFVSSRRVAKDAELQEVKHRVTVIEERVKNIPNHQTIAEMMGDIKAVRAELKGIHGELERLKVDVNRVNDYLLHNK
jgi:polyhydroxyalkanoate synthesis regulator phasin